MMVGVGYGWQTGRQIACRVIAIGIEKRVDWQQGDNTVATVVKRSWQMEAIACRIKQDL